MSKVTVVDYGVGNLRSVSRALEEAGGDVTLTSDARAIESAERLVLPGVGAFGSCMDELKKRNLVEPVLRFAGSGRSFLGICIGMQIMLSLGEEYGEHKGLGLIPGRVKSIPTQGADGTPHTLPYIGWASLTPTKDWKGTVLQDITPGAYVYFLHSYAAVPDNSQAVLAQYAYDGMPIVAAIARDNVTGLQFHPEKSAQTGIRILKRFLL